MPKALTRYGRIRRNFVQRPKYQKRIAYTAAAAAAAAAAYAGGVYGVRALSAARRARAAVSAAPVSPYRPMTRLQRFSRSYLSPARRPVLDARFQAAMRQKRARIQRVRMRRYGRQLNSMGHSIFDNLPTPRKLFV